jgi:predicted aspartyl protease
MARYRYTDQINPPAPYVNVCLGCPVRGVRLENLAALIDTGADRTVLPSRLVEELDLPYDGSLSLQGFAGEVVQLPVYLAEVGVHDMEPVVVRAVASKAEKWVLLGRDVLNCHRILLDGPNLAFEIERPSEPGTPLTPRSDPTSPGGTPPSAPSSSS